MSSRASALAIIVAFVVGNALASDASFYKRGAEGWFWYRDPRLVEEPTPPPEAPLPTPTSPALPESQASPAPSGPSPLSAAWFRDNLSSYRDTAIDNPTPENVAIYFYLQKIAMDKSSTFAKVSERVVQTDPYLDEITQRPTATFGANLANRQSGESRDVVLTQIAGFAAVWFFFRSDCPYCEAQAPILKMLSEGFGFKILPVSIDGKPLPAGHFPDYRPDAGHAAELNVVSTPALFLVKSDGPEFAPIAQGLLSLTQLEDRITLAAVTQGWISEEALNRTKPLVTAAVTDSAAPDTALPDSPADLLALLRGLTRSPAP